ncbi:WecB/TagA/CpsF family glycosyltransferase [Piscinibacter sp. XHJ-5]|uniref:WecB/TagA/CpsF family glycosyltransferase n=1 Tax=Piscinibacter sp. XHJ-5 TaxID=3037797 RepID=UPI002452CB21|nr:WecB/TagA/CpsF family glycosyltransferase [Piscinibacter sp. XHJ-5]
MLDVDAVRGDAPAAPRRVQIGDVLIDAVHLDELMAAVQQACRARTPLQIVTVNIDFIRLAQRSRAFRRVIHEAAWVVPDGRLVLWVSRLLGEPLPEQITGHDLVRESIRLARAHGHRMFLLGGMPGVAADVARRLERENPGLCVQGDDGGSFSADGDNEDNAALVQRIREFEADLLFVALGAPKQELWLARNLHATGVSVAVGVGGVFDTLSGRLPRAPRWMQVAGLESLFQLLIAPRRYARRYVLEDPPTLARVAWLALVTRVTRKRRA